MRPLVVVSHTYVEPENRGKLRALAATGPVAALVPRRWRESALRRSWEVARGESDEGVRLEPVRWYGPARPTLGAMWVPSDTVARDAVVQIEEEPWTPTAWLLARRSLAAATVVFTWENVSRSFPWPWSAMRREVFAKASGLIAGSQSAADLARQQGYRGPLAVIPQLGVDLPQSAARSTGPELRLAFVGRLVREKGVDVMLRAASQLATPWRLTVVGDGPERASVSHLAADLAIGDRVSFPGSRPHSAVAALWPATDVLVLPSRTTRTWKEQFGHVLLEAMAHGVAVVGSTCGAIPEVIGDAGLVVAEGDVAALGAALGRLAGDRSLLAQLGEAGRRRVAAQFTNERIAARTRAFHAEALERQ